LLQSLLSLQPRAADGIGQTREQTVLNLIDQLLEQIPAMLPSPAAEEGDKGDAPLRTVLSQEVFRYNVLLGKIRSSLVDLQRGIKVNEVISSISCLIVLRGWS